ncbi:hypothetical protein C5167_013920, partial [Papaver somniferum]
MDTTVVHQSDGQYHTLLIISNEQVVMSVDTERGRLIPQEKWTIDAIVKARLAPLNIAIVFGVGDGPWEMMKEFHDNIRASALVNFQVWTICLDKSVCLAVTLYCEGLIVPVFSCPVCELHRNYAKKFSREKKKKTEFALLALMEIPSQYKATLDLNLLGSSKNGKAVERVSLSPPLYSAAANSSSTKPSPSPPRSFKQSSPPYSGPKPSVGIALRLIFLVNPLQACPIFLTNPKDMAFGCGHQ